MAVYNVRQNGFLTSLFRSVSTQPRWEKTQVVDQLWSIKAGGKKKKKTTAIISAEDNQTFRQLRGRIIALKARELNILAGREGYCRRVL